MMSSDPQSETLRGDAAIAWTIRVREADFAAWDELTEWLEADPANLGAYERAVAADERMPALLVGVPVTTSDEEAVAVPPRRRWLRVVGGGLIAAGLVIGAVLALPLLRPQQERTMHIATGPGEKREITLASGDRVTLNGDTALTVSLDTPRRARLDRGQAFFSIRHDDAHPFELRVGDRRLLDAGTRFDVLRDAGVTRVAVSEGAVIYQPDAEAIRLAPGQMLDVAEGQGAAKVSRIEVAAVGGWRNGTLAYVDAPLDQVAGDLSRSLGTRVRLAGRRDAYDRFTGTLAVDGTAGTVLPRLAPLLGVAAQREAEGWALKPAR